LPKKIAVILRADQRPPVIHLINPLWDPNGGSDWRTIVLWEMLREQAETKLWTEYRPSPVFDSRYPLQRIRPFMGSLPFGGTLVFVGIYFRIGHWIRFALPKRVVVIYNTDQPDRLVKNLRRIHGCGVTPEVVSTSHALNDKLGQSLPVLESPIELSPFLAMSRVQKPRNRVFTVGRLSRDDVSKHHREDPELYRHLAESGCRVRIMGGTCLAAALAGVPNVELLPAGAESAAAFLSSLDCFIYRTSDTWLEAFGRVIFEAMASGLPVVCARPGGYVDYLTHGRDSLIFERTDDALAQIQRLRDSEALCASLGEAARETARQVVGESLSRRTQQFILQSPDTSYDTGGNSRNQVQIAAKIKPLIST
jgi:glycosyltransferase involved in cell wall biosynthesis